MFCDASFSALCVVLQPLWALICSRRGVRTTPRLVRSPKQITTPEISPLRFLRCSVQDLNPGKYVNDTSPKGIYAFIQSSASSKHWINALASQTNGIILGVCGLSLGVCALDAINT